MSLITVDSRAVLRLNQKLTQHELQPSDRDNWFFRIGILMGILRLEVSEVWLSSSNCSRAKADNTRCDHAQIVQQLKS